MFVTMDGGCVIDFDLVVLVELVSVIDKQIARIEVEISQSPEPDGFGCYDRLEAMIGLGFVACQQYINATYAQLGTKDEAKWRVVASPPTHSCGKEFAQIVDAAANLWKHRDEWPIQTNKVHEKRTREVIDTLTPSTEAYVLCNLLYELAPLVQPRFAQILEALTRWRDLRIKTTG